jgi:uncharacterized protein YwlG (UPF0340 family)
MEWQHLACWCQYLAFEHYLLAAEQMCQVSSMYEVTASLVEMVVLGLTSRSGPELAFRKSERLSRMLVVGKRRLANL